MASKDDLLNKLVELVSNFDDASWAALASVGLLRRARKDLERLQLEVLDEVEGSLQINVPPFIVLMPPSGPANAKCNCPAPDACQHILAAGLFIQSQKSTKTQLKEVLTADSVRSEVLLLTSDVLKSWVGATDYRKGVALLEKNSLQPSIEYGETVIIRLQPSGIEVRFVPGGGLDGMILPRLQGKRAGVAAVLALRASLGFEVPHAVAQQSLVELSGTPRTKKEILDSACGVLEDAVAVGLSHTSHILAERLVTLSISAQGTQLPRVALALRTVADEVRSILLREARADEDRLLIVMARVYALMDAIRTGNDQQTLALAGTSRGLYVEVSELELSGVGAYTWQTGSGYAGLTVLFWANQTKEFLSWSYARPEIQRIDARQRFYGEGPWSGTQSPKQVASSTIKLHNGRRTANGRLSSSTKTTALVLGRTVPDTLDFVNRVFSSWTSLRSYVAAKQPIGLREPNPLDMIVVLEPVVFGGRSFDEISQTFSWEITDRANGVLTLSLPFREWTKESIRTLEELSPAAGTAWRFVVRLAHEDDELLVEPISILRSDETLPVFQLAFDSFSDRGGPKQSAGVPETESESDLEEFEKEDLTEPFVPGTASLGRILTEVNGRLLAIAETGVQRGLATHQKFFFQSGAEVHALGLTALARSLNSLVVNNSSGSVLRTRYLTYLHTQATSQLFR